MPLSKVEIVKEFINSIYWPKGKREDVGKLLTFLEEVNIRSINKHDSRKCRLTCLEITTSGKGERESFFSWAVKYLDVNHVGDTYAEIYVYTDEAGSGLPSKIRLNNPKLSIII